MSQPETSEPVLSKAERQQRLQELAMVFFKLGTIAFGGPAAHIALMDDEVVKRRQWLSRERLLDLLGITNLIPGPNSTELAIHIGYERAGWRGLIVAGVCFILPAMLIVWVIAAIYVQFRTLPQLTGFLYGVKPVIIVIVLQALWKLGKTAIKDRITALAAATAIVSFALGFNELALLGLLGLGTMLVRIGLRLRTQLMLVPLMPLMPLMSLMSAHIRGVIWGTPAASLMGLFQGIFQGKGFQWSPVLLEIPVAVATTVAPVSWLQVFWFFLKVGSVLYGSGYVLLAFLQRGLVENTQWLTAQNLLDAIAIGQVTPGPVFTTATFVGYLLAGNAGAVAGTIGIFLPAFLLVLLINPWAAKLRQSHGLSGFLDGVNAASLGLMAVVSWQLGRAAVVDGLTLGLTILSAVLLFRFRWNSAWLVLGGGVIGLLLQLIR
ncbi:MAG: chromate efflux transporter [Elainella sp. Prado103]|jgi:chromate transporter|nr:chromate efflux transporter [Elainella sp. Prado103]